MSTLLKILDSNLHLIKAHCLKAGLVCTWWYVIGWWSSFNKTQVLYGKAQILNIWGCLFSLAIALSLEDDLVMIKSCQISEETSVQTNKDQVTLRILRKVVSSYRNCFAESAERDHVGYLPTWRQPLKRVCKSGVSSVTVIVSLSLRFASIYLKAWRRRR